MVIFFFLFTQKYFQKTFSDYVTVFKEAAFRYIFQWNVVYFLILGI